MTDAEQLKSKYAKKCAKLKKVNARVLALEERCHRLYSSVSAGSNELSLLYKITSSMPKSYYKVLYAFEGKSYTANLFSFGARFLKDELIIELIKKGYTEAYNYNVTLTEVTKLYD